MTINSTLTTATQVPSGQARLSWAGATPLLCPAPAPSFPPLQTQGFRGERWRGRGDTDSLAATKAIGGHVQGAAVCPSSRPWGKVPEMPKIPNSRGHGCPTHDPPLPPPLRLPAVACDSSGLAISSSSVPVALCPSAQGFSLAVQRHAGQPGARTSFAPGQTHGLHVAWVWGGELRARGNRRPRIAKLGC